MPSDYLYQDQDRLIAWAADKMGDTYLTPNGFQFRTDARAIGHSRNGAIVGVAVFDTFSDTDCLLHVVSDGSRRWLTRQFILKTLLFPFGQLGLRRITSLVSVLNEDSVRFCNDFGWKLEGVLRKAGPRGENMFLFGLLRTECRWIADPDRLDR
jgi:RimJ/RimL family protein N-acetyltransferase